MELCILNNGESYEPTVMALGNFDGVHLGHQELLKHALEKAKALNVKFSVLLFDPHPLKILCPERKLNLLTAKGERLQLFEKMHVDRVFLVPFTPELAATAPRAFVEQLLKRIGVVHIVVGFNYSFGAQGRGTPQDLELYGQEYGFGVSIIQAQRIGDKIISSTAIRKFLLEGNIQAAKEMLGRAPQITGRVIHGDARGRTIGFPTANLQIDEDLLVPTNGVYAVTSKIGNKIYAGMMNIGTRPTFTSGSIRTVEVFFLDFSGDLYNFDLVIDIHARIRSEKKFRSSKEIINQLNEDREKTKDIVSSILISRD